MKPTAVALFLTLAGFATTAARADHSRVNVDVDIHLGARRGAPAYVEPAPVVIVPAGHRHYAPPRGHWDTVTVKTWIPGRWIVTRDRWGHSHRFFERGHFAYRTERVWVDSGRGRSRGRDDRYGYNGGHRGWNR